MALRPYAEQQPPLPVSLGMGHSGGGVSERVDELLAESGFGE